MADHKVYLVDGSGYIFRAFYAIARLSNSAGFPTNALFGFTRMLLKLLQASDSDHVVVVFDAGRITFRNELYPEYKANRAALPDELAVQMPYFREITKALGLTMLEQPGFEADDLIGTLSKRLEEANQEVVIVSGDKDLMQLIKPGISIWDTLKDKHIGPPEVIEKFGVPPDKVVEILGLMGDSSDNVPGLSGVGPKTAQQLIEKYNDIEGIIASVSAIKEDSSIRNRAKIAAQIELEGKLLRLSRQLVEIKCDVPVRLVLGDKEVALGELDDENLLAALERQAPNQVLLSSLVKQFEFDSLFSDLDLNQPAAASSIATPSAAPRGWQNITVFASNFKEWLKVLKAKPAFAFDLETSSLDVFAAKIVGASFSWSETEAYYLPLGHQPELGSTEVQITREEFLAQVGPVLEDAKVKKYGQNVKYDYEVLKQAGLTLRGIDFDTMLAAYLLNPDRGSYNLTVLAKEYLNRETIEFDQVLGGKGDFSEVAVAAASRYACQDALYVWLLEGLLRPKLKAENLEEVMYQIELPLASVLAEMELRGVMLDTAALAAMSKDYEVELEKVRRKVYEIAGGEFNLNSTKQLAEILFERLGLSTKGVKKTKTGISTESSVLEKLAAEHPLPQLLLDYRVMQKLKSTYIDALPAQVSKYTKRLHTRFNQTGTGTGRLSSSEPNLQNIPIQTQEGLRIRSSFIAPPGKVLISADYSQIELRILAHMSGDKNLQACFEQNLDIHSKTAREVLGLAPDAPVASDQRRIGKTINFGIVYGMSGFRLARELGIAVGTATQYIEKYFSNFPGVQEFFDRLDRESKQHGFVKTLFGRKRYIAAIDSSGRDDGFVRRAALNAPLQGSAADIIKLAMLGLEQRIAAQKLALSMLLQIHDELLFECAKDFAKEAQALIQQIMEQVVTLSVPLRVDVGIGCNWQEAH